MRRACQAIAVTIGAHLRPGVFLIILALALAATWYGLAPSLDRFSLLPGGRNNG